MKQQVNIKKLDDRAIIQHTEQRFQQVRIYMHVWIMQ